MLPGNKPVRWGARLVLAVLIGGACGPGAGQTGGAGRGGAEPVAVCPITDPRLNEASGLVASRRFPDHYYTHNDSQGEPHVYVLDRRGRIPVTIRLIGAENVDWEDISLARGEAPGTYDVCVADIGDNRAKRTEVRIYRFPEPDLNDRSSGTIDVRPAVFRCRYEDGPTDAEGFAVHPRTGDGYLFAKRFDGECRVYRLPAPWPRTGTATLKRVGALKFPKEAPPISRIVTAADISPDGTRLVTRSYVGGWVWRLPDSGAEPGFASILEQEPQGLTMPSEPQGEALCFSADGRTLLTISEHTPTTLYEVRISENRLPDEP